MFSTSRLQVVCVAAARKSACIMIVCICHGITEKALREAVREGANTFADLQCHTGVATCCGKCKDCAHGVLDETLSTQFKRAA